jgi:archaellum biogenesis ATPase FlaH
MKLLKDNTDPNVREAALNHMRIVLMHAAEKQYIELRSFSDNKEQSGDARQHWIPTKAMDSDLFEAINWASEQSHAGRGVFIGYNSRQTMVGTKQAVKQMTATYVDLDLVKQEISREEAMARVELAPIEPDLIVWSGYGVHLVYFFKPTRDKTKWATLQCRLYEFYREVGADKSVNEESRVMRLSPFPNQKHGQSTETSIVRFTEFESQRTIDDLLSQLGAESETNSLNHARKDANGGLRAFEGRKRLPEIVETNRNVNLTREAGRLRRLGYEEEEIEPTLLAVNDRRCVPPLPEDEVKRIVKSVCRYEPREELGSGLSTGELFVGWDVMSRTAYAPPEYVIYGLCRGDVGMVQSVTNYGKSTLLRNLAGSLASGNEFMTLAENGPPRRVMLLDYETALARYIEDLKKMNASLSDASQTLIKENLWSYVAKKRGAPYLNLSEAGAMERLAAEAIEFEPDVIIVDTITAGFAIKSENDNSEVTNSVMKPLVQLAVEANTVVLFAHHIGKVGSEEGGQSNGSYRARGASAFEGMAAASIQLDSKKTTAGKRVLVLDYKKLKDEPKPELVLELNRESRWFEVVSGEEAIDSKDEDYHRMLSLITKPMGATQVKKAVGSVSDATRKRYLRRALMEGRLEQTKRGWYQPKNYIPFDQSEVAA